MVNQTLGHYRILAKLGEGGMGIVYRARDEKLQRDVAVKVLAPRILADEAARTRFRREALALSQLNHPHICTIYEIGEADGHAYIAMEFVDGQALNSRLTGGGLSTETAILYGMQIADALAHAHEHGMIHRDLKSSNVVITPDGRAKVLDFGLAKWVGAIEADDATHTMAPVTKVGAIVGTLHYLAPEVLRGESADKRSDIWALGVLLYEMAAGKLPFEGQSYFELSSAILRESANPLSPAVPAGLRAVIQRCLAKEPGRRYQWAVEVRAVLSVMHSELGSAPAAVSDGTVQGRTEQLKRAAAVLSTGAPASTNSDANRYFENAMMSLLQYDLPHMRRMLERALELDPHFAEARAWHGFTYWLMIDTGYSNDSSLLYKAEEEFRRALQDAPNSPCAHMGFALVFFFQGQKELVPLELDKVLGVDPDNRDALHALLCYHWVNGDYRAVQAIAKDQMARHPLFWPSRMDFGDTLREQGDSGAAIREQEKILEQDPRNTYAIRFLARAYIDAGDLVSARRTLESAPPADRRSFFTRIFWALLLALEGKLGEATREMDEEVLKYAAFVVWHTAEVACFYSVLGDVSKAFEWLERAVRNGDERIEWFRREPLFANLRDDPRFTEIVESVSYRRQLRGKAWSALPVERA